MKITFNPLETGKTERQQTDKRDIARAEKAGSAYAAAFVTEGNQLWSQGSVKGKEKNKSLIELQQEAGNANVAVQQDYMTLMSHTMSEEDYAQMSREGFHFESMDPEAAVTIVDKIKAELARSGQHIAGYTDDLDAETLAAAVGSDTLARSISDSFAAEDIPMTPENMESVARAWEMASQLEAPGEGGEYYMIDNGLEPEIWNLYRAQSSGSKSAGNGQPRYYAEDIQGYYTQSAGNVKDINLQGQMDKIIEEAGMEVDPTTRQQAQWLMDKGLPLTADNMRRLEELLSLSFPVSEQDFARAAASAIAEGKDAVYGNLAHAENIYYKASELAENYYDMKLSSLDAGDITSRRQLEEIRLRMTAEVNVKLLKSGFSIDTAPMEQLLEALKQAEAEIANNYFPADTQAVGKYELYRQTTQIASELPQLPVQLLGTWSTREMQGTVAEFYGEGKTLQQTYEKAQESYETLMTAPRSDMGDSIGKAFVNVDDILTDLGCELTEDNRRAVRILGYNRMEITVENMEAVKAADSQVRSVVEKMTPAATLKMIRDGVNPLEQSFEQLNNYFDDLPREYEEAAESYSRFLYQLEQHKEINPQEREAYIGVYRLLRQIEKSDGAVIGALVNTQAEVQFANLLSAVRSNRFRHMDVRATDETGLAAELNKSGNSISDQINQINKEFTRMLLEQSRQAANVSADSGELLKRGELPANAGNLLAAQALLHDAGAPFGKLLNGGLTGSRFANKKTHVSETNEKDEEKDTNLHTLTNLWEEIADKDTFREAYSKELSVLAEQVEEDSLEVAQSSLDVRALQSVHKQLSVAMGLGDREEYILPMYVGEELAKVHVTLERNEAQKGEVVIRVDYFHHTEETAGQQNDLEVSAEALHLEAHFKLQDKSLTGFLVGNSPSEVMKLQEGADIFLEMVHEHHGDWQIDNIPVVSGRGAVSGMSSVANRASGVSEEASPDNTELYGIAKLFLQAIKK